MRESRATESEYTPNMWSARPSSTVAMNHDSAASRSRPKRARLLNSRQATAKGAICMIMSTILAETA